MSSLRLSDRPIDSRAPILESVVTCPTCGLATQETMPTDACVFFYECNGCKTLLRPAAGHCCVFCSYGSVQCPPVQQEGSCCAGTGPAPLAGDGMRDPPVP